MATNLHEFTSLRGFTVALPGRSIDPYYRIFHRAFTDSLNGTTNLADVPVPSSQCFVLTDVRFGALQTTGSPAGNQSVLGVNNDLIFGSALRFELRFEGALGRPGQFISSDASGSSTFAGLSRLNVGLRDLLNWPMAYGIALSSGGKVTTRAVQFGSFGAGAIIPDSLFCEVAGFMCPIQFAKAYLDEQSSIKGIED